MPRVPAELREQVLAYWRGHSEAWKLSGLTQKDLRAAPHLTEELRQLARAIEAGGLDGLPSPVGATTLGSGEPWPMLALGLSLGLTLGSRWLSQQQFRRLASVDSSVKSSSNGS